MFGNGTTSLAGVEVRLGQDGRVRFIVPAQIASARLRIIRMKIAKKIIEMVAQQQELTVIVNPDLHQCGEWLLGGESCGFSILVGSPQTSDPERSRPDDD